MPYDKRNVERFYFGGLASASGVFVTHPLDLMKVLQQTQKDKLSLPSMTVKIVRQRGFFGLYNGISAALLRQASYATSRFGIYSFGRRAINTDRMPTKVGLAAAAGAIGGLIGAPADLINVRMQNDVKLPAEQMRNYKNGIDGLYRVTTEEGFFTLFNGASMCSIRGALMTVGQIAFYEQARQMLINVGGFEPSMKIYIISSIIAGICATTICQPIDVIKTRAMNAKSDEYTNLLDVLVKTAHEGPLAFFKGYVPAFIRLAPHTVILFVVYEYLRCYFGYLPDEQIEKKSKKNKKKQK